MFCTRPATKEVADVASHGAQHLLGICGQKLNEKQNIFNDIEAGRKWTTEQKATTWAF